MRAKLALLLIGTASLLSGCLTPAVETLAAVDLECRVIEFPSLKPIQGAVAIWSYVGPNGEAVSFGPFTSDVRGIFRIVVPEQVAKIGRADRYFAGGYFRAVRIEAVGYEPRQWRESDLSERIDHSSARPIEFRLVRKEPNKAPEPTTTSVTSPAAQEPRQP